MTVDVTSRLAAVPVVPLIDSNDPSVAVAIAKALQAGGMGVVEVVMRNDAALACMEAIIAETEDLIVGAGTVLTVKQARTVVASGSQFIVCPGLLEEIAEFAIDEAIDLYAGAMTAGEVQRAYAIGLRVVKFFPASLAGGVPMLKALAAAFREMKFMPTGGIDSNNLADFLALPQVLACGGSWTTPKEAIAARDFQAVESLARDAVAIAIQSRNGG